MNVLRSVKLLNPRRIIRVNGANRSPSSYTRYTLPIENSRSSDPSRATPSHNNLSFNDRLMKYEKYKFMNK
jgi:hypothetical protein